MTTIIRTKSLADIIRRPVRAFYWRWRAKGADLDADISRDTAARESKQADKYDAAASAMRAKAWRIERGIE